MAKSLAVAVLFLLFSACQGPEGEQGPKGDQGDVGPVGAPGGDLKQVWNCQSETTIAGAPILVDYDLYEFGSGSVMTNCQVYTSVAEVATVKMYLATQLGAGSGACWVGLDVDTGSFGYFNFSLNRTSSHATVTYNDSSSAFNGWTNVFSCQRRQ